MDRLISEARPQEGKPRRPERIEGVDELRRRAEVRHERFRAADLRNALSRAEVGIQVCRTEAVDRLLRVAHEEDGAAFALRLNVGRGLRVVNREEKLLDNRVLDGIRILEFVDENAPVGASHAFGEPLGLPHDVLRCVRSREEPVVELPKKVVEGLHPGVLLHVEKAPGHIRHEGAHRLLNLGREIVEIRPPAGNEGLRIVGEILKFFVPVVAVHELPAVGFLGHGVKRPPQEVPHGVGTELVVRIGQIKVDGAARRKRIVLDHLLAEAVNREDASIIEERERLAAPEADLLHGERVGIRVSNRPGEDAERLREVRFDAGLQFSRCRTREGHHEEVIDRDPGFNDEAKHEVLDRKGLPCTRRCLEERRHKERRRCYVKPRVPVFLFRCHF